MKKILLFLALFGLIIAAIVASLAPKDTSPSELELLKKKFEKKSKPKVDHTKFEVLQKPFPTPQAVTAACISCHNERAREVMASNHWNWEEPTYIEGRGIVYLGKKNAVNNFCLGAEGNELACAKCHVGLGMTSAKTFNYADSLNIDCLICHDNTETYAKAQEKGGEPDPNLDFANIAQHVGKPKRSNCGVCHFFGGGGNNVKHGDLEKAQFDPTRDVDVHMATEASNLSCIDCHVTTNHNISGQMYSLASMNRNRVMCEDCHTETPHNDAIIDKHTYKVSCQTCHISTYAKVNATKTYWDWSTAARLKDGKPYSEEDEDGNHTYLSTKGTFIWGKNLKPEYVWFDGTASHYLIGDIVDDTTKPLMLNEFHGDYKEKGAKIIPVKIMRTKQCFDPVNKLVTIPKLFSPRPGEGAFWTDFNCLKALEVGMKEKGLPFSGQLTFLQTDMNWPINHMVSTKDNSVQCIECHTSNNSRLATLTDFYMPGRDRSPVIEIFGTGLLLLSIAGVFAHGAIRIASRKKHNHKTDDEGGEDEA
jgi:octaheme c-type cytochrome (tetrathionate reductase family)